MQQREKILAILLGGVVLFWFGMPIFKGYFVEPLNQLEAQESTRMQESRTKMAQQIELAKQGKALEDWKRISLPPKPTDAHRLYQDWLTDIALMSGFTNPRFTLENRSQKDDTYVRIPVKIEAEATLQEVAQFLDRFESVDLLQRISKCDVTSPVSEGNPKLKVTLTAEGLSIQSAEDRNELFPQVPLEEELGKEQTRLTLLNTPEDFPTTVPFRIRIGDEFCNVTEMVDNEWTLQRGVAKTFANDHPAGTSIELFPISTKKGSDQRAVQNMWSQSFFTKPAPSVEYEPQLADRETPTAIRGRKFEHQLKVTGWNPAFGQPRYTLINGPEGLDIDERSGTISWPVSTSVETGDLMIEAAVWGSASKEAGFTDTLNLKVRDPNEAPVIDGPKSLTFYLGRESVVPVSAHDPDADSSLLTYSIANGPQGMTIDSRTGTIRWKPPESMETEASSVQVTATDADPDEEHRASTTVTIPISVEEDSARFAYLTASFTRSNGEDQVMKEAWIFDRATNTRTTLHEGDQFRISDFDMTVAEIGPDYIKVRRNGGLYQLNFEQPLVMMTQLAVADQDYNPVPVDEPNEPEPADPPATTNEAEPAEPAATDTPTQPEASDEADADETTEESTDEKPADETDSVS
ncbi:putative Ig domain protein [Thalassoglobus neptunius]|uniref:Putative Ig domain protein n=1 Tax=Thalassoglobus neptunius TaxID=1938619 RepID=A0A5C5WGV8_9PLAN|nr:putative Ig domain-containing protein [Thalassoglobus neptunius]TWT49890.1 putative Ig domain protein [Thalassoglobus neptunius]